ncbi:unnamed protein product [Anisakis simplex]|uniref:Uncharacterized protein n=1 Tax=Anisakis simplex TaxID=6269 RepID=A0A0M3JSK3_ANISI|nr:unnamed protein product [Anisakis simplex]
MMHRRYGRRYRKKNIVHCKTHNSVEFRRHVSVYEMERPIVTNDDLEEEEGSISKKRQNNTIDDGVTGGGDSDAGLDLDEKLNKRLKILDEADEEVQCTQDEAKLKRSNSGRLDWIRRSFNKRKERMKPVVLPSDADDDDIADRTKATQTSLTSFAALNTIYNAFGDKREHTCDCLWFNERRRHRLRKSVFRMQQQYFDFHGKHSVSLQIAMGTQAKTYKHFEII